MTKDPFVIRDNETKQEFIRLDNTQNINIQGQSVDGITSYCVRVDDCNNNSDYIRAIANLPKEQKEELIQLIETKLKELTEELKEPEKEVKNEWIPIKWLPISKVIIAKRSTGYESTEDSGKSWRKSTEGEIKEAGF